jgi:hypothetical protein
MCATRIWRTPKIPEKMAPNDHMINPESHDTVVAANIDRMEP